MIGNVSTVNRAIIVGASVYCYMDKEKVHRPDNREIRIHRSRKQSHPRRNPLEETQQDLNNSSNRRLDLGGSLVGTIRELEAECSHCKEKRNRILRTQL